MAKGAMCAGHITACCRMFCVRSSKCMGAQHAATVSHNAHSNKAHSSHPWQVVSCVPAMGTQVVWTSRQLQQPNRTRQLQQLPVTVKSSRLSRPATKLCCRAWPLSSSATWCALCCASSPQRLLHPADTNHIRSMLAIVACMIQVPDGPYSMHALQALLASAKVCQGDGLICCRRFRVCLQLWVGLQWFTVCAQICQADACVQA